MTTTKTVVGVLMTMVLASSLVGCGAGALHVRRGAWSGELALHGDLTEAEYAAQTAMLDHCGGRSRLLSGPEAERVALADGAATPREIAVEPSGRRIHYVCTSRAPADFRAPAGTDTSSTTMASRGR